MSRFHLNQKSPYENRELHTGGDEYGMKNVASQVIRSLCSISSADGSDERDISSLGMRIA